MYPPRGCFLINSRGSTISTLQVSAAASSGSVLTRAVTFTNSSIHDRPTSALSGPVKWEIGPPTNQTHHSVNVERLQRLLGVLGIPKSKKESIRSRGAGWFRQSTQSHSATFRASRCLPEARLCLRIGTLVRRSVYHRMQRCSASTILLSYLKATLIRREMYGRS
jgi:hypothetical protein